MCSNFLACQVEALGLHVWSGCSLCRPWHHVPEVGLHPWNNVLCSNNLLCLLGWVWKMMVRVWKLIWEGGILKYLVKAKTPEDSRGRKERNSHRAPGIPCSSEEEFNSGPAGQCVKTRLQPHLFTQTFAPLHRQRLFSVIIMMLCSFLSAEVGWPGVSTALCSIMHYSVSPLLLFCWSPI